jgi:hypothetical protein
MLQKLILCPRSVWQEAQGPTDFSKNVSIPCQLFHYRTTRKPYRALTPTPTLVPSAIHGNPPGVTLRPGSYHYKSWVN